MEHDNDVKSYSNHYKGGKNTVVAPLSKHSWLFWDLIFRSLIVVTIYIPELRSQTDITKHDFFNTLSNDQYLYLYKYENVCLCVCLPVSLFAFFSAIWNPIGISFGTKMPYASESVLKQ